MRFVCESCRAQYMINDEKVGPKGVKVRCRKCGYVILVKRADAQASKGPSSQPSPPMPAGDNEDAMATQVLNNPLAGEGNPLGTDPDKTSQESKKDLLSGVGDDEIGAVFDQVLTSGTHPKQSLDDALEGKSSENGLGLGDEQDDRMSTRVLDAAVVQKLAEESADAPSNGANGHGSNGHGKDEVPQTDWFVAIDDKQTGPLTLDKIKEHWDRGEIGPDSLCWRAGFDDWIPVSDVSALASVLAPKPAKPIVIGATAPPPGSVVSVPVESAFSAGGVTKTVQGQALVPLAAAPQEDTGTWKPSAASALSSLIQDEMAALAKPPVKAASPEPVMETKGLLDLPPPSENSINGKNGAHAPMPPTSSPASSSSQAMRAANPYVATPGATYSSPGVTQYRPKENKNLILIIAIAAGVVVIGLFGTIFWLANRQPNYVVVPQQTPPPVQQQVVQQPPPVQNTNTAQNPPPANNTVAQANPPPAQPNGTAVPPGAVAANNTAPQPNRPAEPARPAMPHNSVSAGEHHGGGAPHEPAARNEKPAEKEKPEPAPAPGKKGADDDAFAAAFGGDDKPKGKQTSAAAPAEEKKSKKDVYIPAAPGGGGSEIKDSLGQSDVMEVVLANKGGLASCADQQHKKDPGTTGKLVMKWSILASGKTSNVSVVSEEFKGTTMASCVGALIKTMQFPRSKNPGDPIVFPFKF